MSHPKDLRAVVIHFLLFGLCTIMVLTSFPWPANSQIYVYPRRPNQSNVQHFDFEWHYKDIEVGAEANTDDADRFIPETILERFAHSLPRITNKTDEPVDSQESFARSRRHGTIDFHLSSPPTRAITDFPDPAEDTGSEPPPPTLGEEADDDVDEIDHEFEPTDLSDRSGGVRLYFYERERDIAERAAAFIEISYQELVDEFRHVPTRTLPYVLYNSYQEFLQTNIFPIQEGVLGVTGRADLQLVLPYFGDHRLFQHISTHEMVHQFQIQKARDVVSEAGVSGDPLDRMPLWFIEGMAEYYSLDGLDPEAEMLTRDLLLNPDPQRGYVILDFFEDRPFSQLWTYKIGQARVAFLEDVYGEGTIQRVFEGSYRLVGARDGRADPLTFRSLLAEITGDKPRKISSKFERWIKQRSYTSYLEAQQDAPDINFFNDTRGILQTMTSSRDGNLLMYRSIQPSTGQVRLYITDARDSSRHRRVISDGSPGAESLHPIGPRTFDIRSDQLAYFARSEGKDILYIEEVRHQAERDNDDEAWDISLRTGARTGYDLSEYGLLAAESPAYSPNGRQIAFIGLDEDGQKDLYVFEALEDDDFIVTQLTDDPYAERGVSWEDGQIVYTSDATGHGKYNLFRIQLTEGTGEPERLTFENRDQFDPRILPDGRIIFSAFTDTRSNVYQWMGDGIMRLTDMVTGLFDSAPGPNRSLWATYHYRGQRQLVRMPADTLLNGDVNADEDIAEVSPFPTRSLDEASEYRATDIGNWQLSNIFGILGASSAGVYGQLMLMTNDRLRNHAIFLNVLAFGDLNNTLFDFLYLNQESRLIWGAGLFQDVSYRIDRTLEPAIDSVFEGDEPGTFLSGERFYGARASLRYPFNRFTFIQGDLAAGGVTFFIQDGTRDRIEQLERDAPPGTEFLAPWEEEHDEHRFQTSPSLSLGYNTIRYHPGTGPIDGTSALLASTLNVQPFDDEIHGQVRLDAERYFPIYDRINFSLRGGAGTTFGGPLARQFFLSSFDTLRGVEFGDTRYLLGNQFFFSKAELRFPLNFILRVPLIDIEGMVGADFGGAGQDLQDLWQWRSFSPVVGLNFGLGPLVFRLHFARPIDIGAPELPRGGQWITNFSLGWRYW